jgi:TetR/AcrR family transcriptional regulator
LERKSPTPTKVRLRRNRSDIREALVEFGAKGFDGASTRAIAARVQAHQPRINYHFGSTTALWTVAVDHLFGLPLIGLEGPKEQIPVVCEPDEL